MKKKSHLLIVILLIFGYGFSQQIIVNDPADPESALSAEDLLNQVLINSNACASATLDVLQENPDGVGNSAVKSWGYFKRGTSNFPFEEGIILSSGFAESAEGPNNQTGISDNGAGWGGDNDLKQILDADNGGNVAVNNATVFQFSFTPISNTISFDFIFASDEYENDQECASGGQFRDGFAFLIRGPGIPNDSGTTFGGTNMASIPGSNVSVNTFSIHRDTFMCGGENNGVNYFPNLYVSNSGADNQNEIQFDGLTQVLTAQTNILTPGQQYELKMVIADRGDSGFDSAVFLSSGNFNLGGDLGDDMTIANGNPACEGETITLDGNAGAGSSYTWYQDGVLLPGEVLPTLDVTVSGTYTLEVDFGGNGACISSDDIVIEFKPLPLAGNPVDLLECDQNSTGVGDFTLTDNDANIIGTQTNVTVTYHNSQADADNNANPLASPFNSGPTTIFYRVDDDDSDCFVTGMFQLIAGELPQTIAVSDYELCDDDSDGDDTNGVVQSFDLPSKDAEIINGQANMSVSYHISQADADANANPIASPYTNTANPEQIFYRILNTVTGCYNTGSFNLVVNPLPTVQNTRLEQCDGEDGTLDGLSIYNLEEANPFVITTGTEADYNFEYYLTLADAQSQTNPQASAPFQSTVMDQIIFVRIALNSTGCARIAEIELGVTTTDVPDYPLTVCDDDYDGFAEFDLSQADAIVLAPPLPPGLTVVYYETQNDAILEMNPLPTLYTNIVANTQTIYTRVEDGNSCFGIGELVLQVDPIPAVTTVSDYALCSDTAPTADFDLTSKDAEVLNGQNPADFTVSYHNTQADATAGSNPLASPYTGTDGETIFIRIEDNTTGCFVDSMTFNLIVHPNPSIATPLTFETCDNNNAGDLVEIFDLVSMNDTVTMGDVSLAVSYHFTMADAVAGVDPLPDMYENVVPGMQTIYTRVTNLSTTCFATGEMTLIVQETPEGNEPDPLDFCDDDNDGSGTFDLDSRIPQITTDPNATVTFHLTLDEALVGSNPIVSPYTNSSANNPQTIYIRIEDATITTGCVNTEYRLILNVINSPEVPLNLSDYVICDDDQDNTAVFNLERQDRLDEIFSDPDFVGTPADYTVTFHLSEADADAGLPLIATPTAYTNTSSPQEIWVRVEHNTTGCVTTRSFNLVVNNAPINSTVIPDPLSICDDLGQVNDGISVFDLTVKNDEIAQGNTNVTITYYPSVADATAGTNAIADPTAYTNVTNPQTLGVIVTDTTTGCSSQTILTIEVKPNPTPYTGAIPTLMACDTDSDGSATFDLHENDALILSTDALSQITGYFTSYDDAVNDVNDINDTGNPAAYVNTTNPQTIWVRVENTATGCFEIVSFDIYNPIPTVTLTVDQPVLCVDADGNPLNTVTISTGLDPALYTFAWEYNGTALPDTTASITATAAGTYTVTVSNANGDGCFNTASITIDSSSPPFTYSASVTTVAFAADHVIEATATGNGVYQFSLDGGPFQDSGIFTGVEPGLHYVTIRDVNGCGEVVVEVCVIDYPKYFTPNADGYHDTWNIIGGQCGNITELYIFDRYGKLLKQLDPNGNGWDGTYNGNMMPATDYWFKLLYIEDGVEKEFRSHFAMKR